MAHSAPIFDEGYREEDVIEKRQEKDSLQKLRKSLIGTSEKDLDKIEKKVCAAVLKSIQFAVDAKYPPKRNLYTNLYA